MLRKLLAILAATAALPLLLTLTIASGPAAALPILPGSVTCSGNWSGVITFTPPLRNGGTAPKERMLVKASLGTTANPCVTSAGTPQLGAIAGALKFVMVGANNCANVFSGVALPAPAPASKFKMKWTSPAGAPTVWRQPAPFAVTGALARTNMTITGGSIPITSSFNTYPTPNATLSDAGWPATITAGCSSTTGLSRLTVGTSIGTW